MKACVRCGGMMALDRGVSDELFCLYCGNRVYLPRPKPRPIPQASSPAWLPPSRKGEQYSDQRKEERHAIGATEVQARRRAYQRAYHQRPEAKVKKQAYHQRPEVQVKRRAYQRAYQQRPEAKVKRRAYRQRRKREGETR